MELVEVQFSDGRNNKTVFLEEDEYENLVSAFDEKKSRYSFDYYKMEGDPKTKKRWHLDLNHVIGIRPI